MAKHDGNDLLVPIQLPKVFVGGARYESESGIMGSWPDERLLFSNMSLSSTTLRPLPRILNEAGLEIGSIAVLDSDTAA